VGLSRWLKSESPQGPGPHVLSIAIDATEWRELALDVAAAGGRLLALWGTNRPRGSDSLHAVAVTPSGTLFVTATLAQHTRQYAGVEDVFPAAGRMQRAMFDMSGLRASGGDTRPWLRHRAWPRDVFPLADAEMPAPVADPVDDYAFVRVEGEGVHEIPVGPVHAGIIEPGHFRFSVVGEKVLRLEERLGYVHKGIERRFTDLPILDGHRLAARVSGDSCVAFSWAYCMALERMTAIRIPARASALRSLALELERLANHLGDLGALGNDAGFGFGLAQFSRLKEQLLRATEESLGARYLIDFVVPGGTRLDIEATGSAAIMRCIDALSRETPVLRGIYEEHTGLRDRFAGAGTLAPQLAARLGVVGVAGRASGQPLDLRLDAPVPPYPALGVRRCVQSDGDVLARVNLRFDEVAESLRLVRAIIENLPDDGYAIAIEPPAAGAAEIGLIEGWRGPVVVGLEAGPGGSIHRCHPHDPSWLNWPALEHAIIGNIVPDFPLINKSFNLSYSGHDL